MSTPYRAAEWPHGLRCGQCGHLFDEGEPIAERLDAFVGDTPLVLLVCEFCDFGTPPRPDLKEVA